MRYKKRVTVRDWGSLVHLLLRYLNKIFNVMACRNVSSKESEIHFQMALVIGMYPSELVVTITCVSNATMSFE